jgi:hypothetical protein
MLIWWLLKYLCYWGTKTTEAIVVCARAILKTIMNIYRIFAKLHVVAKSELLRMYRLLHHLINLVLRTGYWAKTQLCGDETLRKSHWFSLGIKKNYNLIYTTSYIYNTSKPLCCLATQLAKTWMKKNWKPLQQHTTRKSNKFLFIRTKRKKNDETHWCV